MQHQSGPTLLSDAKVDKLKPASGNGIPIEAGAIHGDCPYPLARKLEHSLPVLTADDGQKQQVCFWHNTALGCTHPCCPRAHIKLPASAFTAQWHCLLMPLGGHWSLAGKVEESKVLTLLSSEQALQCNSMEEKLRQQTLSYHLANRLASLSEPTNEVISSAPVQSGKLSLHEVKVWDSQAPMQLATPGLMPALEISRAMVGCQDAVFSGLVYDTGQLVQHSPKGYIDYMCQVKAVASVLTGKPELNPAQWSSAADLRILQEVVSSLMELDPATIPPTSRLALLYTMCERGRRTGSHPTGPRFDAAPAP